MSGGVDELQKMRGSVPQGIQKLSGLWKAPLPDYAFQGWEGRDLFHSSIAYIVSAVVGIAIIAGVALFAFGERLLEHSLFDEQAAHRFRRRVGLVFQNADIQLFCPSVREDIAFGPLQFGVAEEEVNRRIREVANVLDIHHLLDRVPPSIKYRREKAGCHRLCSCH